MTADPNPAKPAIGRRLVFLGICLFGYVLLMAGWWLSSRGGPAGPQAPVTILVLPFADRTDDAGGKQVALHLAPDLVAALLKTQGLRVLAEGAAAPSSEQEARELGKKMQANAVLTGGVSKSGEGFRIEAQLVDSGTGYHVWSHTYQRETKDAIAIADVIAKGVVGALQGKRE